MRFFFFAFLLPFLAQAAPFLDSDLKANLPQVIERARAIVKKAQSRGNPHASTMLELLTPSRITFGENGEDALAEYLQDRRVILYQVPEHYAFFNREFMLEQYYPAVLIHEAGHDSVRVGAHNMEKLHGKEFAKVVLSVLKDANVPFALNNGWSYGFDYRAAEFLDFQVELSRSRAPYLLKEGEAGLQELHLRKGVRFQHLSATFEAGANTVLVIRDFDQPRFEASTSTLTFTGTIESLKSHFEYLPLDAVLKAGSSIALSPAVSLKANRDSFIRGFNLGLDNKLSGVNIMRSIPNGVDASFTVVYPEGTLLDVAGLSLSASGEISRLLLENIKKPVIVPFKELGRFEVNRVEGTVVISRDKISCLPIASIGDFEEYTCKVTVNGKKHKIEDDVRVSDLLN